MWSCVFWAWDLKIYIIFKFIVERKSQQHNIRVANVNTHRGRNSPWKAFFWHHFKGIKHMAKFNSELLNVYIYLQDRRKEASNHCNHQLFSRVELASYVHWLSVQKILPPTFKMKQNKIEKHEQWEPMTCPISQMSWTSLWKKQGPTLKFPCWWFVLELDLKSTGMGYWDEWNRREKATLKAPCGTDHRGLLAMGVLFLWGFSG